VKKLIAHTDTSFILSTKQLITQYQTYRNALTQTKNEEEWEKVDAGNDFEIVSIDGKQSTSETDHNLKESTHTNATKLLETVQAMKLLFKQKETAILENLPEPPESKLATSKKQTKKETRERKKSSKDFQKKANEDLNDSFNQLKSVSKDIKELITAMPTMPSEITDILNSYYGDLVKKQVIIKKYTNAINLI